MIEAVDRRASLSCDFCVAAFVAALTRKPAIHGDAWPIASTAEDSAHSPGSERVIPSLPPVEGLPGNPEMPARARHIARPLTRLL